MSHVNWNLIAVIVITVTFAAFIVAGVRAIGLS